MPAAENTSYSTTEVSDTSSFLEGDSADSNSWSDSNCLSELEQLSHELANKGPQQAEVELRCVGQMMWYLIIYIVIVLAFLDCIKT